MCQTKQLEQVENAGGIVIVCYLGLFVAAICLLFLAVTDAISVLRSKLSKADAEADSSTARDIQTPLVSAAPPNTLQRTPSHPPPTTSTIQSLRNSPSHFHTKAAAAIKSKSRDITQTMGVTASAYCDYVWNSFVYCLFLSIVVIPFSMVPNITNGCGRGSFGSTLMKFLEQDTTLWSHATCAAIVNALTALYILTFRRRLRTFTDIALALSPVRSRSVWIRVSTLDALKGCTIAKLTMQLNNAFPGQVFKIQPLGESRQLEFLWAKIQTARDWVANLKRCNRTAAAATMTLRPRCCSCSSTSVPALDYWQDEYKEWLQAALDFTNRFQESSGAGRTHALADNWLCGCAGGPMTWHYVVVFNSYEATVACLQRYDSQDVSFAFSGGSGTNLWGSGKRAPEECEWLWGNVHISPLLRTTRSLLLNAPLVVFAFLFSVPTLLSAINVDPKNISSSPALSWLVRDLESISPYAGQLLSTWVPSLVIVIANNIMFALLDLTSKHEGHATTVGRLQSLFYKTLLFLSLNILLLPAAAATSVLGIITQIQTASLTEFASHVIVEGPSQLFISVMLQSAFIGNAFQLLHFPERFMVLWNKIVKKISMKSSEVKLEHWPFPYGYHVAFCAVMVSIITMFSVTVPLIAPAGALFFAAKLSADKYDILVLCPPDGEKEAGLSYGKAVPVVSLASLIFFNVGMFSQFLLLKVDGPAAVAGVCLSLSVLSCIVWAGYTVRNKRRQDVNVSLVQSIKEHVLVDHAAGLDEAKERALLASHTHPLLRNIATLPETI